MSRMVWGMWTQGQIFGQAIRAAFAHTLLVVVITVLIAPWAVVPAGATQAAFQDDQKRVALVIGVGTYQQVPPLANPGNDAAEVASALGRLGFDVHLHIDPVRTDFEAILRSFRAALIGADIGLFYYAGHSIQVDGKNYIIPTDARLDGPPGFEDFLIDIEEIDALMKQRSDVRITILDACRDNPFIGDDQALHGSDGQTRSIGRGLAPIADPDTIAEQTGTDAYGSVIAYAAAPGRTASDGDGKHSPYTAALLENLEKPGLEIGRMFRNIAASVIRKTSRAQLPEYLVRLTDEVYFRHPEPSQCDFLAAAPFNPIGVTGIDFERIDTARAIPACEAAVAEDPDHPRHLYNLGRALDSAGDYKTAVAYYRESADRGYAAAISSLGVMHVNGQGTEQDFDTGVDLLNKARSLGSRTARISLSSSDFSVLFEAQEFRALQAALKGTGHYSGPVDGIDGPGTRAALYDYQTASDLATNGVTLETLDRLELLGILPNYELN